MLSDLPLIDQVWAFSLVLLLIVACLTILVLLGPGFVREVLRDARRIFTRAGDEGPGPTDPSDDMRRWLAVDHRSDYVGVDLQEILARDADIQELR